MFSQQRAINLNTTVLSNVPPQGSISLTIGSLKYSLSRASSEKFILESDQCRRLKRKGPAVSGKQILQLDRSGKVTESYFKVAEQNDFTHPNRIGEPLSAPLTIPSQKKILDGFNTSILGRARRSDDPFHLYKSIDPRFFPEDPGAEVRDALAAVERPELGSTLEHLAFPRDFITERAENERAGTFIINSFKKFGYTTEVYGEKRSIFAYNRRDEGKPVIVVGAHFDGVPRSPGADDNASSVAAVLHLAKILSRQFPKLRVVFCAFNAEEHGKLGSAELVAHFMETNRFYLTEAHILDMIGFTNRSPDSQQCPLGGMLRPVLDRGDFVGVYANVPSHDVLLSAIGTTQSLVTELPIVGLESVAGGRFVQRALNRSDHTSFWDLGVPAILWTDTSSARNPHYHTPHDIPETIDYDFLYNVTQAVLATVIERARRIGTFAD